MSSIDDKALRRFFAERLTVVAETLRRRGYTAFSLGPDEDADTWYVDVDPEEPVFIEVEVEQMDADLRGMWEKEGLPELAALSTSLVKMGHDLRADEDESADISPFMYVMY